MQAKRATRGTRIPTQRTTPTPGSGAASSSSSTTVSKPETRNPFVLLRFLVSGGLLFVNFLLAVSLLKIDPFAPSFLVAISLLTMATFPCWKPSVGKQKGRIKGRALPPLLRRFPLRLSVCPFVFVIGFPALMFSFLFDSCLVPLCVCICFFSSLS